MQLKKPNKSLILLLSLLLIGTPTNSQASQTHSSSNPKKLVIPMLAFTFLSNRLMTLSDTKQSMSLFGTIQKLNVNPDKLTQDEMKGLNEYVKQETIQLGNQLPSIKDHNKLQTKQNTYQQLTSLQQQLALLHKASFPQALHRPHELQMPANGKCLYTSIILGYLLPVVNNQKAFDQRLRMIMDKQKLPITNKQLANHYNDLDYLDSNPAFQQIINALLKQIGIKPGTWGGPKEIRLIAEKLNVNIQEYTPNPDSPKQLIKGDLTSPKNWLNAPEATLHVVQDTPLQGELVNPDDDLDLQQGRLSSLQGLQNRHHYRLYYTGTLPQPMPKAPNKPTNKDNQPKQKHTDEENPKHTSILPDNAPQPKTSLPDLLKTHYKAQNQIPGMLGDKPQPLESCYIHLAMLTEEEHKVKKEKFLKKKPNPDEDDRKEDSDDEESEDNRDDTPNPEEERQWNKSLDYAVLHKVEKPIKLADLWKPQEKKEENNKKEEEQPNQNKTPCHVVVTGEAGTGKSTLSQYIAYQWAKGSLWQDRFHWVLQLPLRKVRDLSDQQSSHNQIATALGIPNLQGSNLQHLLQQKQPGLLILDGYDEVAIEVSKKENNPLAQWLQPCFDNKDNLSIILTTRPGPHCPYVKQPRDLWVLGFQQQDIDRYVKTYFTPEKQENNNQKPSTSKKATALLKVMQQNPTLKLLSHTPLYLRLLCILAKQQGANALSKCSTPQLYEQIIAQFLCYHLARHNNKPLTDEEQDLVFKTYGLELAYLGELALEGMKASQAVLPIDLQNRLLKNLINTYKRKHSTEPEHWTRIASLGLLQGYTCSSPRPNLPTYFPHLTIQEWLAAHYLVTALYDSEHKDHHTAKAIINQDKYAPRYQVMLPFVAGICYQHIVDKNDSQGKGLTAFWTLLNAQPRELSGIHHAMLIARCLEACAADTSSTMLLNLHKPLIQQAAAWLQALLDHPFDEKDVFVNSQSSSVLLPRMTDILQTGLQGCPILLSHALITQHVKPAWHKLSLEGGRYDTTTQRWHTRVAKIKAVARLPLSHPTAKHLSTYLGQALQHKYDGVRSTAAKVLPGVLQALESQDRKAFINPFIGTLKDKDRDVRYAAAEALPSVLASLEPQDRKALMIPFIGVLKDKDRDVRIASARALPGVLQALEPEDRKAFMIPFIGTLKDKDYHVRKAAAEALPGVLKALESQDRKACINPFIGTLKDKDSDVRSAAIGALPGVLQALESQDRKAFINPFIDALKDKDYHVRRASARALPSVLASLEPEDRKAFIINALKDTNEYVRLASARALPGVLQALESQDRKALMIPFIGALKDTNEDVRREAAVALPGVIQALAPQDRKAFIIGTLKDKSDYVRLASARALPGVLRALESQDRKACINPFIGTLKDKDSDVRSAAIGALPGVLQALESQDRKAFINPFIDALKDKDYHVRRASARALPSVLASLEPEDRKAFIINALKDTNEYVRLASARALPGVLQALESQDRKALMIPFIGALKDTNEDVRREAAVALPGVIQALAPQDRKAFIIGTLKDKSDYVRLASARALPGVLRALESQDRKALMIPFIGALKDTNEDVRREAAVALPGVLKALESQDRKAFIIGALKDKEWKVRLASARALPVVLQALESQDRKACINPFIDALKDKNWSVRRASARALPGVLKALESQDRKACINPFIGTLKDKNWSVRSTSERVLPGVLQNLAPQDCKALMIPFIDALKDKEWSVRSASARALPGVIKALEPEDRKACINPFIGALNDEYEFGILDPYPVRCAAIGALPGVLQALEPEDRKALMIPIIGALKDEYEGDILNLYPVRCAAIGALPGVLRALESQDRKACIKPFIDALKDKEWKVRLASARALPGVLQALESQDRKAFIIGALKDKDYHVRSASARVLPSVLASLEPQDRKALMIPVIGALNDEYEVGILDPYPVRCAAIGALPGVLKALEPQDRKALIIGALKDNDYSVRKAAARALQEIDNKIWQSYLQYQLQAKPKQPDFWDKFFGLFTFTPVPMEDPLKAILKDWAYLLLRGSLLICFNKDEQRQLPSYLTFIQTLQTQATTWGWPVHAYSVKPLPDDFKVEFPKLPGITIHRLLNYTPLHDAAKKGNVQALETLWQDSYYHQYLNDQHNQDQLTPLLCALKSKQWKAAEWLINKGAWLDIADTKDSKGLSYTCFQLILSSINPNTPHLAKLADTLLSQRRLFPIALIKRHLTYAEEKEQGQETYDQDLCTTVAQLLGDPVDALYTLLHDLNNRKLYRAAALNMLESKQQGLGKMDFTKKGWDIDFLKFRIAVLYDLLVRIKKKHFIIQLPTNQSTKKYYRNKEVYEMGLKELQVVLTTFWDYKTLEGCFGEPKLYQAWAQGIVHRLPRIKLPQETSLFLSYTTELNYGHCIYVSLTHTSKHYIVRIDNRWLKTAPKNTHPEQQQTVYQEGKNCIQPYAVAYFPVIAWDKHKTWLVNYIMKAGQVNGKSPTQVISWIYQKNKKTPKIGDKPTWIKQLPWRPLQIDENNCFMRSHNVGYRIRMGNDLYEWFRQKALGSYLLDEKFVKRQLSSSPSKGPKLQGGSNQMGNNKQSPEKAFKSDEEETKEDSPQPQPKDTTYISPKKSKFKKSSPKQTPSSKKLPSHQKVMKRFAKKLRVNYDAVYSGIAAAQALVYYANITRNQTGARLGRDRHTGETLFRLNLTYDEATLLVNYYKQRHPHAIKKAKMLDKQWVRITFDTARLYHEIIPTLSLRQQKARKTGYNKQQGQGHQVMNTNKKPLSEDTKYISPKKSKFKKSSPKPTTSSKKLPSHQEVMQRFAKKLRVNYDAVYSGIAAEQAIVRYAGVSQTQTGAMFRRDSQTGYTWFKLRLNSYEANLFMDHYQTLHPDAIKKRTTLGNGWVRIVFDTARLYDEIIPNLV